MNELTHLCYKFVEREDLEIVHGEPRTGDILHSYADLSLAKELLGYEAGSDAISGFENLYNEYLKNPKIL